MMEARRPHCPLWYPAKEEAIRKYFDPNRPKVNNPVSFGVCPHAGWIYSGLVAGSFYSALPKVDTAVCVGTNHTGTGPGVSIFPDGFWDMPLGQVPVDGGFAQAVLKRSPSSQADKTAHEREHSVEVQVPFLQVINPEVMIVPIEMKDYRYETCKELGEAIASAIDAERKADPTKTFAVIASSDMTHCGFRYGQPPEEGLYPGAFARKQDELAIQEIVDMNPENLLKVCGERNVTMCGPGPAATVMVAAKALGACKGTLLSYKTSADITGKDSDTAVGYAGILMTP